jgi:hypothetical protein
MLLNVCPVQLILPPGVVMAPTFSDPVPASILLLPVTILEVVTVPDIAAFPLTSSAFVWEGNLLMPTLELTYT